MVAGRGPEGRSGELEAKQRDRSGSSSYNLPRHEAPRRRSRGYSVRRPIRCEEPALLGAGTRREVLRRLRRFSAARRARPGLRRGRSRALRRGWVAAAPAPAWTPRRAFDVRRNHNARSVRTDPRPLVARPHERARMGGLPASEARAACAAVPRDLGARAARGSDAATGADA
jgi:hypothetical protein